MLKNVQVKSFNAKNAYFTEIIHNYDYEWIRSKTICPYTHDLFILTCGYQYLGK